MVCQNCKSNFTIESDDFNFYEKIKVPPPTFCPECRLQRRLAWRNERTLYRRTCNLCNKNIIAMYHKSAPFPVYCHDCWFGDGWDPLSFGRRYDMSRSFFDQYKELSNIVPKLALWQRNSLNSNYSNFVGESKNIYLSVSVVKDSENVFYSKSVDKSKDIIDCLNIKNNSESLYENIEGQSNYNSQYLLLCRSCIDSYYLVDCVDCSNCFLSFNLRNKKFCIQNKQYNKEEYLKELQKFNLKSMASREIILREFEEIKKKSIFRFANINKCVNVTGNNLLNVKNGENCFEIYNAEDVKYCYRAFDFTDSMDFCNGTNSESIYEYITGAFYLYNVKFSHSALNSIRDADYTESCMNCKNIFGCISLQNTENSILNKIYSKEEYNRLRTEIIKQMSNVSFEDKNGRVYKYGEFFPIELSPFAYNETIAQEFFPIIKKEANKQGYLWRDKEVKNFNITIFSDNIPDNIDDVNEVILKEVLGCGHKGDCDHQCNIAFRLTDYELKFYKKHSIPIPNLCPNCRHYERFKIMPALKLWTRSCMCDKQNHFHGSKKCNVEFKTSYAPERPEKVYCESCYNKEVY